MKAHRGSILYAWLTRVGQLLRQSRDTARTTRIGRQAAQSLAATFEASRLGATGRILSRWTRQSWLYRWLTAEPEPDVIVIDLRETWTVGPVITVLDAVLGWPGQYWSGSVLQRLLEQGENLVRGSRLVGALAAVFEPPEPPERD